jgi:hypothetical protein
MKVKIRKYPTWWGPYQAMETVFFWAKTKDEHGFSKSEDWVHDAGEWYADTWLGRAHIWLANKYQSWQESRRVNVHIDSWDVWSMDATLAEIALPMLLMLRDKKHGAPNVDPEDVPENLRPGKLEIEQYNTDGTTDELFFKRWEWVMDEMIWAFSEHTKDWDEAEGSFHTGNIDIKSVPVDEEGNEVAKEDAKYFRMDRGPNDTSHFDKAGYEAWLNRKQNGFRLFGKYYTSLWD